MIDENKLIKLWEKGLSGKEIALELGTTRSAVLGKIHRLREKYPISRRVNTSKMEPTMVAKQSDPPIEVFENHTFLTLFDLKRTSCRYIIHMDSPDGALYCGEVIDRGAYCKEHADRCYYKLVKKNDDPNQPGNPSFDAKWKSSRPLSY